MDVTTEGTITAAGALLARLKALGVDWIFANSGTDFPPVIEGLAEAAARSIPLPQALVLTAIVISFGTTAFLVALALRAVGETGTDHVDGGRTEE